MLTRALFLAVLWLLAALLPTLLAGARLRRGSRALSLAWLAAVLLLGDLWALFTFGLPREIAVLSLIAFLLGAWWIRRLADWNALGQVAWSMALLATALFVAYSVAVTAFTPLHPLAFVVATVFFFVEAAALTLGLTFTYEALDVTCRLRWRRRVSSFEPVPGYLPRVSLHVPTYNEPPEVVEATLRALARLDYPNYEVLLVDNNTPREETWRPLEAVCEELGPHFRCVHLDQWPGYKSGALNFALAVTDPEAEIIGIVDADYQVVPAYLRDLTPAFADPDVAFVQTPQDYRDYEGNPYLEACYNAYKYFFEVSMPSRNEHNAIIFGGTMGLIRKSVLQKIGGWDEWCITEDAEASLRILKRGYRSYYVNRIYGRGLMPFTFEGLKKQRFRWCFGGVQILKKHWEALVPWAGRLDPENRLTRTQRYFYLVGGLQWFNDVLNLAFVIFLLLGVVFALSPLAFGVRPLASALVAVPALFLLFGLWRFLWVLRHALRLSPREALLAMGNFFSLGWSVTLGAIQGLIQPQGVFMRTPKSRSRSGLLRAVRSTQWETGIGLAALLAGGTLAAFKPQPATLVLAALMVWQAGLYLAAPAFSLLSIRGQPLEPLISRADISGRVVPEQRAARWALALLLLLLAGGFLFQFAPTPSQTPRYARLQPAKVPVQRVVGLDQLPFEERDREPPPAAAPTGTPTSRPTQGSQATAPPPATEPAPEPPTTTPRPTATPTDANTAPPPTTTPQPTATPPPPPTETTVPTATDTPLPTGTAPGTTPAPTATTPAPTNPAPTNPAPTQPPATATPAPTATPLPTNPAPTNPAPTNPAPTNPAPTNPAPSQSSSAYY